MRQRKGQRINVDRKDWCGSTVGRTAHHVVFGQHLDVRVISQKSKQVASCKRIVFNKANHHGSLLMLDTTAHWRTCRSRVRMPRFSEILSWNIRDHKSTFVQLGHTLYSVKMAQKGPRVWSSRGSSGDNPSP